MILTENEDARSKFLIILYEILLTVIYICSNILIKYLDYMKMKKSIRHRHSLLELIERRDFHLVCTKNESCDVKF